MKKRRQYPDGGTVYRDNFYEASAQLAYYKDILNKQLQAKNPQGYKDYFGGMKTALTAPDVKNPDQARRDYIQKSQYNDFLTPQEVQKHLGGEYQNYLNSINTVNTFNVAQGLQPLYGDIEGEKDINALNYGRRFASLRVTPSVNSTVVDQKTKAERKYARNYSYTPETGTTFTETGDLAAMPSYIRPKPKPVTSTAMMAMGGIAEQIPGLLDAIISMAEGSNQNSQQPTLNASTMKGMVTPYSFANGGQVPPSLEDLGIDPAAMEELQAMAQGMGITLEQLLEQLQQGYTPEGEENIPEEEEPTPEEEPDPEEPEEAQGKDFAESFAYGGKVQIEAEGKEVIQTPSGRMAKLTGPSHANGGVKLNVPAGTKIYSDRLMIGGKSMQERKVAREKRIGKINGYLVKNPTDGILKNTLKRVMEQNEIEDKRDMAIQEVANMDYNNKTPKFPRGGVARIPNTVNTAIMGAIPTPPIDTSFIQNSIEASGQAAGDVARSQPRGSSFLDNLSNNAGDYVGAAGTLFGAIAPISNTINNAANAVPNVNRYQSFGQDALNTNQAAIDIAAKDKVGVMSDIDTSAQSGYARNRNSARSINTLRALDSIVAMGADKAKAGAENTFTNQKLGVLGQRTQLQNQADVYRMRGEQTRDAENKADYDNFYSNFGQNLASISTSVQELGRNINIGKSNRIDANLISQLSQYGLMFDENGKLISKKNA